jgi:hypothetical protein
MSGLFDPTIWTDGNDADNTPDADDLNTEWYDSLQFLLGYNLPIIHLNTSLATSLTTTETNVLWNNEYLRRNMTHSTSTNSERITVPYTGQYQGYMYGSFDSVSNTAARLFIRLRKNAGATELAQANMRTESATWALTSTFTADLVAGDYVYMTMNVSTGTANTGSSSVRYTKMAMWYAGEYS